MARDPAMEELIRYDNERRAMHEWWRENPCPPGTWRHEGYYGCGAINSDTTNECACGFTVLRVAPMMEA